MKKRKILLKRINQELNGKLKLQRLKIRNKIYRFPQILKSKQIYNRKKIKKWIDIEIL